MLYLMLFAALGCAPASSDLVGLWESTQTSKGGIGNSVESGAGRRLVGMARPLMPAEPRFESRNLQSAI
jgi:hypothetical protein